MHLKSGFGVLMSSGAVLCCSYRCLILPLTFACDWIHTVHIKWFIFEAFLQLQVLFQLQHYKPHPLFHLVFIHKLSRTTTHKSLICTKKINKLNHNLFSTPFEPNIISKSPLKRSNQGVFFNVSNSLISPLVIYVEWLVRF